MSYLTELTAEEEEVCEFCGGTGICTFDESDGEGHWMRGTGSQTCICKVKDDEEREEV